MCALHHSVLTSTLPAPPHMPDTMDILQHASHLNRAGATALSTNNSLLAFEYFRNALGVVLFHVPLANRILKDCPSLAKVANSLLLQPQMYRYTLWAESPSPLCPSPANFQEDDDHHIYAKAFVFQPREDSRELALQIPTYLSVVLFNLANTFHQQSRTMPQKLMEQALRFALELYDVGFDILIQEESCCMDDWSNNISLAILNNTAEILWALLDFSRASRVVELQKGLLEIIISSKRPVNFSDQEMELFIWNTHLLQAPAGAAAA